MADQIKTMHTVNLDFSKASDKVNSYGQDGRAWGKV